MQIKIPSDSNKTFVRHVVDVLNAKFKEWNYLQAGNLLKKESPTRPYHVLLLEGFFDENLSSDEGVDLTFSMDELLIPVMLNETGAIKSRAKVNHIEREYLTVYPIRDILPLFADTCKLPAQLENFEGFVENPAIVGLLDFNFLCKRSALIIDFDPQAISIRVSFPIIFKIWVEKNFIVIDLLMDIPQEQDLWCDYDISKSHLKLPKASHLYSYEFYDTTANTAAMLDQEIGKYDVDKIEDNLTKDYEIFFSHSWPDKYLLENTTPD